MQSTRTGINEYTLTNGERVLVEVGEIPFVEQSRLTFVSLGGPSILGIVSGELWMYVFSQHEVGGIYSPHGKMSFGHTLHGQYVLDIFMPEMSLRKSTPDHMQVLLGRRVFERN